MSEWIPDEEWEIIVENAPIVSVDLVVECPDGILLGKRSNEPAKGEWFVPGGRVRKAEHLKEAVHRVANEELDADVEIKESLGAFEHFYDTSEFGCKKHYVAHGFHVWCDKTIYNRNDQHDELNIFSKIPSSLHPYVEAYISSALDQ